jgi:AraC-like DNA-binding protein
MTPVPSARHLLRARDLADRHYGEPLLRNTDRSVSEICLDVGLVGLGSFTTSFKRHFGKTPTAYRASFPPACAQVIVPACYMRLYGRPQHSTKREDLVAAAG